MPPALASEYARRADALLRGEAVVVGPQDVVGGEAAAVVYAVRAVLVLAGLPLGWAVCLASGVISSVSVAVLARGGHGLDGVLIGGLSSVIYLVAAALCWKTRTFLSCYLAWLRRVLPLLVELDSGRNAGHSDDEYHRLRRIVGFLLGLVAWNMSSAMLGGLLLPPLRGQAFLPIFHAGEASGALFYAEYLLQVYSQVTSGCTIIVMQCCQVFGVGVIVVACCRLRDDLGGNLAPADVRRAVRLHGLVAQANMGLNAVMSSFMIVVSAAAAFVAVIAALHFLLFGLSGQNVVDSVAALLTLAWPCILGDLVSWGGEQVVVGVLHCDWTSLQPPQRRELLTLLVAAQRPFSVQPRLVGPMTLLVLTKTLSWWFKWVQTLRRLF